MDVYMIWVTDSSGIMWLVEAWDDDSIMSNSDGWEAALAKAEQEHGARFVRVAKTHVDIDAIAESFQPVEV